MKKNWNLEDMPDQTGKTVLITGANDGLGYHLTKAFVQKHAKVIMACRNMVRAGMAKDEISQAHPGAELDIVILDLGDLASVEECAGSVMKNYQQLDVIMCNAGVMAVPYGTTKDGLEIQMGVNYYGHFALIGKLMPLIRKSPGIRIVTTSSTGEKFGRLKLDREITPKNYRRWIAYGDSKLAILMFALILDKQFRKSGLQAMALSAHPGFTRSNLRNTRLETEKSLVQRFLLNFFEWISMSIDRGILPLLYAATDPAAEGGQYIGVTGIGEWQSPPKIVRGQKKAYDENLQQQLWQKSEALTGVSYEFDH